QRYIYLFDRQFFLFQSTKIRKRNSSLFARKETFLNGRVKKAEKLYLQMFSCYDIQIKQCA
ncbi:MAG: hypothetical protein M3R72_12345, partial [Bacteroidota bacterium]|nr:hypothetical protein [Bacteroidota bacterium]